MTLEQFEQAEKIKNTYSEKLYLTEKIDLINEKVIKKEQNNFSLLINLANPNREEEYIFFIDKNTLVEILKVMQKEPKEALKKFEKDIENI